MFPSMGSVERPWNQSSTDDWRMASEMIVTCLDLFNPSLLMNPINQSFLLPFFPVGVQQLWISGRDTSRPSPFQELFIGDFRIGYIMRLRWSVI